MAVRRQGVICLILVFVVTMPTIAGELSFGTEISGMGGAGVALTKDVYAAYWNPAGLTRVKRFSIAPNLAAYTDAHDILGDFTSYFNGSDLPDEPIMVEGAGIVGFATPRFAFNMAGQALAQTAPGLNGESGQAEAVMVYNSKVSMALPISIGMRTLSLGATFNYYSAHEYDATLEPEWADVVFTEQFSGAGRSFDFGAQVDLVPTLRLGMVARNLAGTYEWSQSDLVSMVQPVTPSYQAGLGWETQGLRAAFDWQWDEADLRKYRVGLAKDLWKLVTLRVGGIFEPDQEPTYTGGISLRLGGLSLNLAAANQEPAWSATVSMAFNL